MRKALVPKNRFGRYFFYAVGEIVLVVIGILIALSVNTWNENRKVQNKVRSYLTDVVSDLQADTAVFSRALVSYEEIIQTKESELLKTDFSNVTTEKLYELITQRASYPKIVDNTYQKIRNAGLTELSDNIELSNVLNEYYIQLLTFHNVMMDWENRYTSKEADFWHYEQNEFETNSDNLPFIYDKDENRKNLIKLIKSHRGRNYLIMEYDRKIRMVNHFKQMREEATVLIQEIQKELEQ